MKLMTYNIFEGATKTLPQVIAVIQSEKPDYLTINEANTFIDDDFKILKNFAKEVGFPYYKIAHWESHYHVVALSKYPFKKVSIIQPLNRAYIQTIIETPQGELSIVSAHLHPKSETERLQEIEEILVCQTGYERRVIMGDLNSLSRQDKYPSDIIELFNDRQISKFATPDKKLRHEVIDRILAADYFDPAVKLGKNSVATVPTAANHDLAHACVPMRLDYIFLSNSLAANLKYYSVLKNSLTDSASDHYPVVVEI